MLSSQFNGFSRGEEEVLHFPSAISCPLGNVATKGALQVPSSEPAPQVKSAVDGVLDLFKLKPVIPATC